MRQKHRNPLQKELKSFAFTLVELMFAVVVLGVISIALTSLMFSAARSMQWSVNKSMITNDFRQFTQQASQDAVNASFAVLYLSFDSNDCNDEGDRRATGLSGDCLVLVSTVPSPTIDSQRFYESIVVYNRVSDAPGNESPVFRREITFLDTTAPTTVPILNPEIPTTVPIETLLSGQRNNFEPATEVLQLSRGLSENQLFLRATEETFIINGEIIHGNNVQRITNTYNLTISTRG